jgi:hypothetical protein
MARCAPLHRPKRPRRAMGNLERRPNKPPTPNPRKHLQQCPFPATGKVERTCKMLSTRNHRDHQRKSARQAMGKCRLPRKMPSRHGRRIQQWWIGPFRGVRVARVGLRHRLGPVQAWAGRQDRRASAAPPRPCHRRRAQALVLQVVRRSILPPPALAHRAPMRPGQPQAVSPRARHRHSR